MQSSSTVPRWLIALAVLAGCIFLTAAGIFASEFLRVGLRLPTAILIVPSPTLPTTASPLPPTATLRSSTPVPVITAIPPSLTPSNTPTQTNTPLPTLTPTPTDTPMPTLTPSRTRTRAPTARPPTSTPAPAAGVAAVGPAGTGGRCVSVVGDSVAYGSTVFEIPGLGYVTARLAPMSTYIEARFRQRGDANTKVYNRSAPAVGLITPNLPSYLSTPQYISLMQDGCQYVVIIPWINDLSAGGDTGANANNMVSALANLSNSLISRSPGVKILVVNYYNGTPQPFALRTFATGFTPGNIAAYSQQIAGACSGGALHNAQIVCVDSNGILAPISPNHVAGPLNKQALDQLLFAPPSPEESNLLSAFFSGSPDGQVVGDGVHLSAAGKARLADGLMPMMP